MSSEGLTTFADRLRWARQKKGLTQVELATETGVHKDTLSGWESDPDRAGVVREANLRAVARVLGVSVVWLRQGGATPRIPSPERRSVHGRRSAPPAGGKGLGTLLDLIERQRGEMARFVAAGKVPPLDQILVWWAEMEELAATNSPGSDADGEPEPPRRAGQSGR